MALFRRRRDGLSLSEALPDRSLFALVAMMGFLAAMTLAGASGAQGLSHRWAAGAAGLVTVQVPDPDLPAHGGDDTQPPKRIDAVLDALASLPQGTRTHRLEQDEINQLLAPWLGKADHSALPLPAVIRINMPPDTSLPATLEQTLGQLTPGVMIEQNALWSQRLHDLATSLLACSWLALLTVGGIGVVITALATRSGLTSRWEIIQTLHGLGASDGYIAGRFARRTASLGLGGGITGTVLACLPLFVLVRLILPFSQPALPTAPPLHDPLHSAELQTLLDSLPQGLAAGLALLPIASAAICWLTTQIMVRLWLRNLP